MHLPAKVNLSCTVFLIGNISLKKHKELYEVDEEIKRMILSLIKYLSESPTTGPKYKLRQK